MRVVKETNRLPSKQTREEQKQILRKLQARKLLILKPADKGGNVVLMIHAHYEETCFKILNLELYKPIFP